MIKLNHLRAIETLLSEMIYLNTVFLFLITLKLASSEADFAANGDCSSAKENFVRSLRKVKVCDGKLREGDGKDKEGSRR